MTGARSSFRRRALLVLAVVGALAAVLVVWASDVDTRPTADDASAIAALGVAAECASTSALADQITCLRAIQRAHLEAAPDTSCVHEYGVTSHEPAALLERGRGCCYDRSRLVEKAALSFGMEVRHIALYHTTTPLDLVRGGTPSHSLSEVRTEAGWMVVDSNQPTLGLRADGAALDAEALGAELRAGGANLVDQNYREFFGGDFVVLYGVYSRHGGFYPPYVYLPDVDWAQLHHNL